MSEKETIAEKWDALKKELLKIESMAKIKTDFDLQDDMNIVINKLNYHVKYSLRRYGLK